MPTGLTVRVPVVRAAGIEPASHLVAANFKSAVFTNFTTPAFFSMDASITATATQSRQETVHRQAGLSTSIPGILHLDPFVRSAMHMDEPVHDDPAE